MKVDGKVNCGDEGYFVIVENTVTGRHNCTGSVAIPLGVTAIAEQAFDASPDYDGFGQSGFGNYQNSTIVTNITSLTIPATVTSIGDYAFRHTHVDELVIPHSVTSIGVWAFAFSSATSLSIGNGLSRINESTFAGFSSLQSLTIGTGVRSIGAFAFDSALSLTNLTIPDSVESIEADAFRAIGSPLTLNYCGNADLTDTGLTMDLTCESPHGLSAIVTNDQVEISFTPGAGGIPIENYKYSFDGISYTSFSPALTVSPVIISGLVKATSYRVYLKATGEDGDGPPSMPVSFSTGGSGYISCGTTGYFNIDNYVVIESFDCGGVVTIPDLVTAIGVDAFRNETDITSVTFASNGNLESIGQRAFMLDLQIAPGQPTPPGQLTSITIPRSVKSIDDGAFLQSDLSSITFEPFSSLESIGFEAFAKSMLTAIVIPSSVTLIDEGAFSFTPALGSVTFAVGINIVSILRHTFREANSLIEISIPASVEYIGEGAFMEATALTSVTFDPNSWLRTIGTGAFGGTTALETIEIPATVEMIGAGAFYDATSLTSVTFAADSVLMSLGDNSFRGASSLSVIDIPDNDLEVGQYAFYGTAASLFSSSYVNWKSPLSTFSNGPKIGEKIFASAFEKGLSILGLGPHIDEYVYRITMLENVATSSVDRQVSTSYTPLDIGAQNRWYEDIGFDSNNPYQFSWHVFMCVGNANGTVSLTKPTNLSLSYASRDVVPTGSSSQNHWAAFRGASQALHLGSSPSTRTVVGKLYDVNTDAPQRGSDITDLDQANLPYSLGISEVHSSCGAGKTLEALQIVQPVGTSPIATKEFEITPVLRLIFEGEYFSQNSEGLTIGVTGGGGGPPPFGGSYNAALWGLTTIASANPPSGGGGSSGGNATPVVSPNAPSVQPSSKTRSTIIAGFAGDSSKAPATLRQRISRMFSGFNQVATAECTGYTSGRAPSRWDTLLANRRAKVACDLVKQRHPSAKVKVIEKPAVGVGSKFRSVRIKIVGF